MAPVERDDVAGHAGDALHQPEAIRSGQEDDADPADARAAQGDGDESVTRFEGRAHGVLGHDEAP